MNCAYADECGKPATHISLKETLASSLWYTRTVTADLADRHHAEFCKTCAALVTESRNQKRVPDPKTPSVVSGASKPKRSRKKDTETV